MITKPVFTFVVRKKFGTYNVGDIFEASVRTFVEDLVEKQDFELTDGNFWKSVPAAFTQFAEETTV